MSILRTRDTGNRGIDQIHDRQEIYENIRFMDEMKFNSLQMQKSAGYLCTRENERWKYEKLYKKTCRNF